jgi:N,N'-diacetyllegionaminate synthase
MAKRAEIIAELASNHCGDWELAERMIATAADCGADWVKVQLYDASLLRDDDPQKDWLTKAQVDRAALERLMACAEKYRVKFTASVFGIPQAQMAKDAGLTTIKIGSGEVQRHVLVSYCTQHFTAVWISGGLVPMRTNRVVPFHSVSQYPTPPERARARLLQANKYCAWGWSDHGIGIAVCQEAMDYGATYMEKHFSLPGGRQAFWDASADDLRELRRHAEAVAWEGTAEHAEASAKFLGRWGQ